MKMALHNDPKIRKAKYDKANLSNKSRKLSQNNGGGEMSKSTYNDRDWIKEKELSGLAQNAHIKTTTVMEGKSNALGHPVTTGDLTFYKQKKEYEDKLGRVVSSGEFVSSDSDVNSGTSIFDPVLCELMYKWFCIDKGSILDPFAGGSVRGIVANYLGYYYTGIDLRPEQIEANNIQAKEIIPVSKPNWICGNSLNVNELVNEKYDFVFSCPPYYDLEIYSDNQNDLSNYQTYEDFIKDYNAIIKESIDLLKEDRFTCFVVGDIRDKKGFYRNFVSDTISAFEQAGAKLYNEAILVTSVGSLPIRVGKQFDAGRKLGKTHQNILIFFKGNPKTIKENYKEIEVADLTIIN